MMIDPARIFLMTVAIILFILPCTAQKAGNAVSDWEHHHDSLSFAAFDPGSGSLLECSPNGYRIYRKEAGAGDFIPVKGLGSFFAHYVFPVTGSKGAEWILINDMGGLTYRLSGSELSRMDKGSVTRMSVTMTAFTWRDTIFSQGGYGFWSAREYVTWFDMQAGDWKVHRPMDDMQPPPGLFNHLAHLSGDSLFIFGGSTIDSFDPIIHHPNAALWLYDMKHRKWKKLGSIDPELAIQRTDQVTFRIHDRLLVYPVNKMIAEIDFHEGLVRYFKPSTAIEDMVRHNHPTTTRGFIEHGRLYYFRINDKREGFNPPHRSELVSVPLSRLYGEPAGEKPLLTSRFPFWWWLALPLLFGAVAVARKLSRFSDTRIQVAEDGFIHQGSHFPAPLESVRLINLLLASDGPVNNSAVMALFLNPSLDYSNNIRLKNQMVEKTNILLKSILNVQEDLVTCDRSPSDKRMRTYAIRREYFRKR